MDILIINPMQDIHCENMVKRLKQRGISFKELGSPLENDYALVGGHLYYNGERMDGVYSAYFRSVMAYDPQDSLKKELQEISV